MLAKQANQGDLRHDLKSKVWVHDNPSSAEAPKIANYQTPSVEVGDILLNINPDMSKPELRFASWICVSIPTEPYIAFKGMEAIF